MVGPAFATSGCRNGHFVGSYTTSPNVPTDVFGDGSVFNTYIFQLHLNGDGTATQYWTGFPDYLLSLGTGSQWMGSWKCRNDGKLVIVLLRATYLPVGPNPPNVPTRDVALAFHTRTTYLFSVDDDNTVTRIQARSRFYTPDEDPSNATGGTLGTISNATVQYTRFVASDADLTAP